MKKNRCDSRRFWDRRSRIYDAQVIPEYKGTYKKIVKRSAHFLSQEDRILEIGCGTGNATIPLAGYVKKITVEATNITLFFKNILNCFKLFLFDAILIMVKTDE